MQSTETKKNQILRTKQVRELCGIGRTTLYDKMNPKSKRYDATFPRPIKLSLSAVGWFEQDIVDWLNSKKVDAISAIT
ncbi:helix-turn-helix transcriptional regulator [Acinetobacter sp. SWAC57]|uniref:helix-turn-helix transcriptional regulator n=1 Tax=Acinetobacter sp. SWAC57 TaxID=2293834 RepID=UPI000E5A5E33|nr:AlpA family phage regulatory protein [Acinetobacter sp. SWAC57]RGD93715.1 AlpA family phage regulatory protein [Acinetobacter sp. SWAC57]